MINNEDIEIILSRYVKDIATLKAILPIIKIMIDKAYKEGQESIVVNNEENNKVIKRIYDNLKEIR